MDLSNFSKILYDLLTLFLGLSCDSILIIIMFYTILNLFTVTGAPGFVAAAWMLLVWTIFGDMAGPLAVETQSIIVGLMVGVLLWKIVESLCIALAEATKKFLCLETTFSAASTVWFRSITLYVGPSDVCT